MTEQARIIVIGGGIVGCSTAYHLAQSGEKDVLLLEKGELTSGSTWHAAGLVGQLRSSRNITKMLKYSVELYNRLEAETGLSTGWKPVGGLRLASSKDRMYEIKKAATTARSFGLEMHVLSPQEALDLFPLMSLDKVEGAAFLPSDGQADPSGITQALARGARSGGVRIKQGIRVTGIKLEQGRIAGVETDQGFITCEIIVNCCGMWAREVGKMVGVNVPLIPVQHQYLVSDTIEGMPKDLPTMRDPDNLIYYKQEMGGLVMGGYEPNPIPWSVNGIPKNFGQELLAENFDHFASLSEPAMMRTPDLEKVGVRNLINGPEAFTPDGTFIMGEAPELKNFFVGAGFNAHGIAAGGGAGKMLAEWVLEGRPSLNLWEVDIRRFGSHHRGTRYAVERTCELYGKHYAISWPFEEHATVRGVRKSSLYETLKANGAVFGNKFGWERPNWFAPKGTPAKDIPTFEQPNWFEHVGNEHKAIRERVALIDQSSFSKMEISGPAAVETLNRIATNNMDKPVGALTYTQLCNDDGGIEADLTMARVADDRFYVVTGTAFGTRDRHWIEKQLPADGSVSIKDVTSAYGVINLCGPMARKVLEKVCDDDISHEGFKFATCKQIHIGHAPVLALRVTYVGELGWEFHISTDYVKHVYDLLWAAGQAFHIANAGYRAIESTRLEKGYLYWSTDIHPDYNPYEAGLGFCVPLKKKTGDFTGRAALEKIKAEGVKRQLACFTLDIKKHLFGGETILHEGVVIDVVTSGGYGYTVGKTIAYGYLPCGLTSQEGFEIELMGERHKATRMKPGSLYDPKREKILC